MTYAIVETGGKQMRVEPGRFYDIELLAVDEGEDYTLDRVLLLSHEDEVTVGQPLVPSATVEGTILSHRRDRKVLVYKMRPKKKTRKKRGHRQTLTRFLVRSINIEGQAIAEADPDEIEIVLAGLMPRTLPAELEEELAEVEPMLEAERGDGAALFVEEPVAEAAEPEAEEPVAEAEEPVAEEPVAELEESEAEEPVAEAAEPEAEEPVAEVEEPEAEEPTAEVEEPEAEETAEVEEPEAEETAEVEEPEAEEPTAEEPTAEVEEPEAEEPEAEVEEPALAADDEDDEPVAQDESE